MVNLITSHSQKASLLGEGIIVKSGSIYSWIQFKILEDESFTLDFGDESEMKYTLDFVCRENLIKFHSYDLKVVY